MSKRIFYIRETDKGRWWNTMGFTPYAEHAVPIFDEESALSLLCRLRALQRFELELFIRDIPWDLYQDMRRSVARSA